MSRKSRRRLLRLISAVPGLYALVAFVVARRVHLDGLSMSPTLLSSERALFDRLAYQRDGPARGDIVLVRHPANPDLSMVKRITAVPGDITPDDTVLERGEYWVEGDNAIASTDSRAFGTVSSRRLLARAWLVYWPYDNWRRL